MVESQLQNLIQRDREANSTPSKSKGVTGNTFFRRMLLLGATTMFLLSAVEVSLAGYSPGDFLNQCSEEFYQCWP